MGITHRYAHREVYTPLHTLGSIRGGIHPLHTLGGIQGGIPTFVHLMYTLVYPACLLRYTLVYPACLPMCTTVGIHTQHASLCAQRWYIPTSMPPYVHNGE